MTDSRSTSAQSLSDLDSLDLDALPLSFEVGHSLLPEFVLEHDAADVLKELVQNEYDAGGSHVRLAFGTDSLTVRGDGRGVDAAGWRRLSVMLGHGRVAGSAREVEAKTNSIGSKNFGLRSLFLFGDLIRVRSRGKETLLHLSKGALRRPQPVSGSPTRGGVEITVPYRRVANDKLEPFGANREKQALERYSSDMSEMLIKLAQPRARRSLTRVTVTSKRCDRSLSWSQTVRVVPTAGRGVTALLRRITMRDTSRDGGRPTRHRTELQELEFQKACPIPPGLVGQPIPGYFNVADGRIRIGLSLRMRGKRIDSSAYAILFYPLGVPHAYSGNAVNLCAPFEMESDRSDIVAPENSPWNQWLLREAADFTLELLVGDWFDRFGADAYLAVKEQEPPFVPEYLERIKEGLTEDRLWPTRVRRRGHPRFECATDLAVPSPTDLDGFIDPKFGLHQKLASNARVQEMAVAAGAKTFSVDSLVHLRCAAEEPSESTDGGSEEDTPAWKRKLMAITGEADNEGGGHVIRNPGCDDLATPLDDDTEADLHYPDFPRPLKSLELQQRFADALGRNYRRASAEYKEDLRASPTTLTAARTLEAPAAPLYVVEPEIARACPVPESKQLHPALAEKKVITRLCRQFDPSDWALDVARRADQGEASAEERRALYRYLLSSHAHLRARAKSMLRNLPVLLDHAGNWVAPGLILVKRTALASRLAPVLHFPHRDYSRDSSIAKALRFRRTVDREDIVKYALTIQDHSDRAPAFEETLLKSGALLTPGLVKKLREIDFLRDISGGLGAPQDLYVRNAHTLACLGAEGPFVAGDHTALYKRLGCRTVPRSDDVIAYLARLREAGQRPKRLDVIYPALVDALRSEKAATSKYESEAIVWSGSSYNAPEDTLLGSRHRALFFEAVPQVVGPANTLAALEQLGAHRRPLPHHWSQLLSWIAAKYGDHPRAVTSEERRALIEAYRALCESPESVPEGERCLLDRRGFLHSRAEVRAQRLLLNDDPQMAEEVERRSIGVAFVQSDDDRLLRFYDGIGVRRLTAARQLVGSSIGDRQAPLGWYRPDDILQRLGSEEFISAIRAVAAHELYARGDRRALTSAALRQLRRLRSISFAREIRLNYRLAGATVSTQASFVFQGNRLVLASPKSKSELDGYVAEAVASLLVSEEQLQRGLADTIFRMYLSRTPREMRSYLHRRGVPWSFAKVGDEEEDERDEEAEDDLTAAVEEVGASLKNRLAAGTAAGREAGSASDRQDEPAVGERDEGGRDDSPLPPIESVALRNLNAGADWHPGERGQASGGGGGGWRPRTSADTDRDREIGRRGEEIVYRAEVERVKLLGHPVSSVVWTSESDPAADHDIRSLDDSGEPIWIEVKSTTGRHGRFEWSEAEFLKAVAERDRYVLVRVYEAHTDSPSCKKFRNPVAMIRENTLRLDVASLSSEVEPLAG